MYGHEYKISNPIALANHPIWLIDKGEQDHKTKSWKNTKANDFLNDFRKLSRITHVYDLKLSFTFFHAVAKENPEGSFCSSHKNVNIDKVSVYKLVWNFIP